MLSISGGSASAADNRQATIAATQPASSHTAKGTSHTSPRAPVNEPTTPITDLITPVRELDLSRAAKAPKELPVLS